MYKWLLRSLTLGMLAFIWGHSLMNASASASESETVLHWTLSLGSFLPGLAYLNIYAIRKLAHQTEFALLGLLLRLTGGTFQPPRGPRWAFFCGALAAALDETLQLLSPGRSAQVSDVLLDSLGVLAAILFYKLLQRLKGPAARRKTHDN